MVSWVAADVGRACVADERTHRPGAAKEVDGAVHGREAELRLASPSLLKQIDGCEAAFAVGDQVEERAPLGGEAGAAWQPQTAVFGLVLGGLGRGFPRLGHSLGGMIMILIFRLGLVHR